MIIKFVPRNPSDNIEINNPRFKLDPASLAATKGIVVTFFSSRY